MVQAPAMSVVPKPSPAFGTIRASKKRLDRTETDKSPRPACTSAILRTDSSAELAQKPQEIRAVSYTFYGAVCAPRRGPKTPVCGQGPIQGPMETYAILEPKAVRAASKLGGVFNF